MRATTAAFAIALAASPAVDGPASAHATRSASIEIVEMAPGQALLHVRTELAGDRIGVDTSAPCALGPVDADTGAPASSELLQQTRRLTCPGSVAGASLTVSGLGPIVTQAIVLYRLTDGRSGSTLVRAASPEVALPQAASAREVARTYVGSGVWHILQGYDHLLFLLLLVLNLRTVASVLVAETAFTLSHSLSFSATALGWIRVSPLAAEACIALSLVLMALDIRPGQPAPARRGASLAFVFGLVHGLGFAGALAEFGLPDHDVALALAGFAGGVEVGQVLFLAAALGVVHTLTAARPAWTARLEPLAVPALGGVSTYWLIDRVAAILAARV